MFHSIHRWIRRLRRKIWPRQVQLVYDPRYEASISGVPLDPLRGDKILTFLFLEELIGAADLHRPKPISLEQLRNVHSDAYLESLQSAGAMSSILGLNLPDREQDELLTLHRLMVGGSLLATDLALRNHCLAFHLGGGFHHARPDRGGGFCVFNDIALAALDVRAKQPETTILIIDCDLHDGEGTRLALANQPMIHNFSIHNRTLDLTPVENSTVLELGSGVEDAQYLAVLHQHLPPLIEKLRPGFVFYLAGCDPAITDTIGDWKISAEGLAQRDQLVLELLQGIPKVLLLAGGYGQEAWRPSARLLGQILSGKGRTPAPPSNDTITMARLRHRARKLLSSELRGENAQEDWSLSEEDLYTGAHLQGRRNRFLDFYSQHGLELALERYGFFGQLRALGFLEPCISLELNGPSGDQLKIFGDSAKKELLVEMCLDRDRRTIPGFEMLRIEWLLLQNPRASFSDEKKRLPGQNHPGLGLLTEVIGLLVMVCQRLNLDGLLYVPSHYHLARISAQRGLRFLDPDVQKRFEELVALMKGLSLEQASWETEHGAFQPHPMVYPISERFLSR